MEKQFISGWRGGPGKGRRGGGDTRRQTPLPGVEGPPRTPRSGLGGGGEAPGSQGWHRMGLRGELHSPRKKTQTVPSGCGGAALELRPRVGAPTPTLGCPGGAAPPPSPAKGQPRQAREGNPGRGGGDPAFLPGPGRAGGGPEPRVRRGAQSCTAGAICRPRRGGDTRDTGWGGGGGGTPATGRAALQTEPGSGAPGDRGTGTGDPGGTGTGGRQGGGLGTCGPAWGRG